METTTMLTLTMYLAFPVLALLTMARKKTLSLHQLRRLGHLRRSATLSDWLAVCNYLGVALESRNPPPVGTAEKPRRPVVAAGIALASVALLLAPLRFNLPASFAQYRLNFFPLVQASMAGALLAFSLLLVFNRPRRWFLLSGSHTRALVRADYPFLRWSDLRMERKKGGRDSK
jgi:hypothetical protein